MIFNATKCCFIKSKLSKNVISTLTIIKQNDVVIFILFPFAENTPPSQEDTGSEELGIYTPENITEKLIIEKVDEFLKKMIEWEVPTIKNKVGFVN